jgi:hypothetical protein
VEVGMD